MDVPSWIKKLVELSVHHCTGDANANGRRYSVQSHPFSSKSSMNETPVKWMKIEETRIATKVGNSLSNVPGPLQKCEISSDAHEIPERKIAVITFSG